MPFGFEKEVDVGWTSSDRHLMNTRLEAGFREVKIRHGQGVFGRDASGRRDRDRSIPCHARAVAIRKCKADRVRRTADVAVGKYAVTEKSQVALTRERTDGHDGTIDLQDKCIRERAGSGLIQDGQVETYFAVGVMPVMAGAVAGTVVTEMLSTC